MAIPTTTIPGTQFEQQQSPRNTPTCPVSSVAPRQLVIRRTNLDLPHLVLSPLNSQLPMPKHNLNANEDQYGPLPEGWEIGIDHLGLTYYVNHHTCSITRDRPSPNQAVDHQAQEGETTTTSSGSLPRGWEERHTPEGRPYYVNHTTRSTTVPGWIQDDRPWARTVRVLLYSLRLFRNSIRYHRG